MKLKLEIYSALCSTSIFIINGIHADSDDFGEQTDVDSEKAEDYACGNMKFIPYDASNKILEKYKITKEEYNQIIKKLKEGLSFGKCGWCV